MRDLGRQNLVSVVADRGSRVEYVSAYFWSISGLSPVDLPSIF
jgi:hypothetical protein